MKIALFGGFLGSGKTTLIAKLVSRLTASGKRVAVVTNDQGEDLVDTSFFRDLGLPVGEVPKGCFCCNFPSFIKNIETILRGHDPEFILAEPVGSCTDLAATVAAPLRAFHRKTASLNFFGVVVDALRLSGEYRGLDLLSPVSPEETLIAHQIREAPVLLLSKIDCVNETAARAAAALLRRMNPRAEILPFSGHSEEGVDRILSLLLREEELGTIPSVPLDYELYARAEADYGWYNGTFTLRGNADFDPGLFGMVFLRELARALTGGIAHAKLFLASPGGGMKLSLAGGIIQADGAATISPEREARVVLNIRARTTPEEISGGVEEILKSLESKLGIGAGDYRFDALVPSPPKPTHRIPS